MTRDFVGYGATPPHANWPGDARVAVNFVINFEEGSELSYPAGDGVSETGLIESASIDTGMGARSRRRKHVRIRHAGSGGGGSTASSPNTELPVTLFACARAFAANPPAAAAIAAERLGHLRPRLSLDQALRTATKPRSAARSPPRSTLIRETTGKPTLGWYCRYSPSVNTRRIVAEHGGFLYDSDAYNDELPYWVRVERPKPHLVVPYTLVANDVKFGRGVFGPGDDFFAYLRDTFDVLYEEGAERPRMMSVGLHMRLAGHPGRAAGSSALSSTSQRRTACGSAGARTSPGTGSPQHPARLARAGARRNRRSRAPSRASAAARLSRRTAMPPPKAWMTVPSPA